MSGRLLRSLARAAALLARRLRPAAILIPIVLTWLAVASLGADF